MVSRQQFVQRVNGRDGLAIEVHHHVTLAQAGALSGAAGRDRNHQHAARSRQPVMPHQPATYLAVSIAMAKQMPCAGRMTAVLMHITSQRELTSGPPYCPGFNATSVWMISSINRPVLARKERPRALTTPAVTVHWKP